jgi:hypothetical protein
LGGGAIAERSFTVANLCLCFVIRGTSNRQEQKAIDPFLADNHGWGRSNVDAASLT